MTPLMTCLLITDHYNTTIGVHIFSPLHINTHQMQTVNCQNYDSFYMKWDNMKKMIL